MKEELKNIKFNMEMYKKALLITEKQKDFILDNLDYFEDDITMENVVRRIDRLTKEEASKIIKTLKRNIDDCYSQHYY